MQIACSSLLVWLAASTAAAGAPKLVEEALTLARRGDPSAGGWEPALRGPWDVQLSPDGGTLLYVRQQSGRARRRGGQGFETRTIRRLVLRDLATMSDTVLPAPAMTSDDALYYLLTSRLFNPGGTKLVLGVGVDDDQDGVTAPGNPDRMRAALYDVAAKKLTVLDLEGPTVLPSFDRTGKTIFALSWDLKKNVGTLHAADAEKPAFQPREFVGLPRPPCPTAGLIPMLAKPAAKRRFGYDLVLYDAKADRPTGPLPTEGSNLDLIRFAPQWTRDGRYLYYRSLAGGRAARQVTAVWDRTTGQPAGRVADTFPLGPGDRPTGMVLGKFARGRMGGIILHDAAAGKSADLAGGDIRPLAACGGRVLYVRHTDEGEALFSARIAARGNP